MRLILEDNAFRGVLLEDANEDKSDSDYATAYRDLRSVAEKDLNKLLDKGSLIYFGREETEIDSDCILELYEPPLVESASDESNDSKDKFGKASITTGNIAGFIQSGKTQVNINSRFYDRAGNSDYFLYYLLMKLNNINIANLDDRDFKSDDSILNLLILAFPFFLNKAFRFGVFRTYRTFEYDNSRIKGQIDIPKFLKRDMPFMGKISHKFREFTSDNYLLELVRHTIEYIRQTSFRNVLSSQATTRDNVRLCIESTPNYKKSERARVMQKNLKAIHHPYYRAYTALQRLCLMVLQGKRIVYDSDDSANRLSGILFDVAYLWEEYLATMLKKGSGFEHPENKSGKGGIRMFDNDTAESDIKYGKLYRRIYPDFYKKIEDKPKESFLLDAKYKRLDDNLRRDDLYQIVTYMHTMKIDNGGFIYPTKTDTGFGNVEFILKHYALAGYGGTVFKIGFPIPQNKHKFQDFREVIEQRENSFVELIRNCTDKREFLKIS